MASLLNKDGVQYYSTQMVKAENRKVNGKPLPSVLNEIDSKLDEMKTLFDEEYGTALDMKLENSENVFSVGTGTNVDKRSEVENSFTEVELSGSSLVNLWAKRNGSANLNDVVNNTNNEYVGVIRAGSDCGFTSDISNIKSDTYTVIFDLKTDSTLAKPKIMFFDYGGLTNAQSTTLSTAIPNTGWNTYMLTKNVTKTNGATLLVGVNCPSSEIGLQLLVRNIIVLEGDYTNKPIPQYFEGMKSVGQDNVNGHKIEILSSNNINGNKYYFETDKIVLPNGTRNILSNNDYTVKIGKVVIDGTQNFTDHSIHGSVNTYRYSVSIPNININTSNNQNSLGDTLDWKFDDSDTVHYKIGVAPNTVFLYIPMEYKGKPNEYFAKNPFTLYYEYTNPINIELNKKEILLNEPLRGLPNGVKDTIEKINGEWKIIRRCSEIILNGGENWTNGGYSNADRHELFFAPEKLIPNAKKRGASGHAYGNYISDRFPTIQGDITTSNKWLAINGNGGLTFALPKTELTEPYYNKAKQWLSENPTTLIYELATPIIEDIEPLTLQCWKNGTISIDEVLPVESTHTVALNKPAQIKRNIEELTALRKRVQALEDFYDQIALEQAHQLSLINHSIELDYNI